MKIHIFPLICFLSLIVVSDAQGAEDKNDDPNDGDGAGVCPPVDEIVDGEPCGDFIPAGSQEASCFTSETEQCDCPGQENPNPVWECRDVGDNGPGFDDPFSPVDPVAAPVSIDMPSEPPVTADDEEDPSTPTPTTPINTDLCPPVDEIVDGDACGAFIPADSQEVSCFTSETEQCNCAGQESTDPVWQCRTVGVDPPENCASQTCVPDMEDQCTCRPGLECRQRQPGVYQCSQVSRTERTRLSGSGNFGGAAGRDRGNREGLVSF